jgi:cation diffusion facilitator family transporter
VEEWTEDSAAIAGVKQVGWVGLLCNLLVAALKAAAGLLGNSQAVLADSLHSLTDCITDVAVILGVKYWTEPADERHPHGHGRIETLVTVAIGLAVAGAAVGVGLGAIRGLKDEPIEGPALIAMAAALVSIGVKEALYRWTRRKARLLRSPALEANAWHHRSDAISSIPAAVAVGAAVIAPQWAVVDRVGAVVVCLLILQAAWRILSPAVDQLIDAGAPAAERKKIEKLAIGVPGVESAHAVRTRYLGSRLAVDLHVEVDGGLSVAEGFTIAKEVRRKLVEEGPHVADVIVQIEPHVLRAPE